MNVAYIKHDGVNQPVSNGVRVEVKLRNGWVVTRPAEEFRWVNHGSGSEFDISEWRQVLDLKKPVQTRSGLPARIICTDAKNSNSEQIIALVMMEPDEEVSFYYSKKGEYIQNDVTGMDLVNTPPQVYSDEMSIGDICEFNGHVILRTYVGWVDLNNPSLTWEKDSHLPVKPLPNAKIVIDKGCG